MQKPAIRQYGETVRSITLHFILVTLYSLLNYFVNKTHRQIFACNKQQFKTIAETTIKI